MATAQIFKGHLANERTRQYLTERVHSTDLTDLDISVGKVLDEPVTQTIDHRFRFKAISIFPEWTPIGISPFRIEMSYDEARILRDELTAALKAVDSV
jgi:hypothetical protein